MPRGNTINGQVSIVAERPASALWDRATLSAELAGNSLLDTTVNPGGRHPATTRSAAAVQAELTLDYFHVLPALDISPFVAASYGLGGRSSVDAEMVGATGDATVASSRTAPISRVTAADVALQTSVGGGWVGSIFGALAEQLMLLRYRFERRRPDASPT